MKEQSIVIKASSGLSDEEVDTMVADAEANAEAGSKSEEVATTRNILKEALIQTTNKTTGEAGDKGDGMREDCH